MSDVGMTEFERFAMDHNEHAHCAGCGGCMLDPRIKELQAAPVWCMGCVKAIHAKMPVGAPRPWAGGVMFCNPGNFFLKITS